MSRKIVAFCIKLAVTVGLFVLLFRPQTFGLAADTFGGVTPGKMLAEIREVEAHHLAFWLLFAAVVKLAGMLAGVLRWRLLLQGQGLKIPFWYMVQSWFVGRFIGIFLPGTIGLDGYRLYDSSRYTGEVIKSTTVIAVEKLIGFIALTFLVFLTFPLGFKLLDIKLPVLVAILAVLGTFVSVTFLLLLNPRVIQVLVAVVPTPRVIRDKFDKLGSAVTAYSGSRRSLLLAVAFGIMVHLGTCFMYFGTMMAIRASNTDLLDILFASPLMIYGTVLGPSVGGEGIREIVFVSLLSGKSGAATAATFAHLGWWIGELVPFLIGLPIFVLRSRPARKEMESELAEARALAVESESGPRLTSREVGEYRRKLIRCGVAGILAGLVAGAIVGLTEAGWLASTMAGLSELGLYWWGPLVYGPLFAGVGLGVAAALVFLYLLLDRFAPLAVTFGLCAGGAVGAAVIIIGRWRFQRDVLGGHGLSLNENLLALGAAVAIGAGVAVVLALVAMPFRRNVRVASCAALASFALLVLGGAGFSAVTAPDKEGVILDVREGAGGPNIILIAVDALRADFLSLYSDSAVARTPNLRDFAADSILFGNAFAQSSWTKPSFGTIFSGLYPGAHTATSKTALLPDAVETFPELLSAGGYFTKGFANNPNITAIFNFDQGFTDYVDLKPDLYFGASPSASKLSLYEVLRRVRQQVEARLMGGRMVVTDFYQPAEAITQRGLDWLDGAERPAEAPFFLFLHYMDPHDPFMDWERPGVGYARVRLGNPDPEQYLEKMKKAYVLEIEYLDEYIGKLMDGLKERGLYEDTVIVFTADHGEEFFDHEGWWHGQTLYDELVRIPLILKLPGMAMGGTRHMGLAHHVDIAPTLLGEAGLPVSASMHGVALVQGGEVGAMSSGYSYAEVDFEGNVLRSVRTPVGKLTLANEDNNRGLAQCSFYDLVSDPGEAKNLCGEGTTDESELRKLLNEMEVYIRENAAKPVLLEALPEDLEEQLESIGYSE